MVDFKEVERLLEEHIGKGCEWPWKPCNDIEKGYLHCECHLPNVPIPCLWCKQKEK